MALDLAIDSQSPSGSSSPDGNSDFKEKLQVDGGRIDSLRRTILAMVTDARYEKAIRELSVYADYREDFPDFKVRTERHVQHCIDLVNAIKTKRSFPGMAYLSAAKQKELHDTALAHFDELKYYLRQIEKVEIDVKLVDARSTVWFLQTVVYCFLAVFVLSFLLDLYGGMGKNAVVYLDDLLSRGSTWIFGLFGS